MISWVIPEVVAEGRLPEEVCVNDLFHRPALLGLTFTPSGRRDQMGASGPLKRGLGGAGIDGSQYLRGRQDKKFALEECAGDEPCEVWSVTTLP